MKTKLINGCFLFRKGSLKIVMKTIIFLLCTTIFALSPNNIVSQNSKIEIDRDTIMTVDEVFDLIMKQTDYKFFYEEGIFKDFPKVNLKKGIIRTNKLLNLSLSQGDLKVTVNANNAILIENNSISLNQPQQFEVSGTITDIDGVPLPGATILEKGTNNGTQSDFDGKFSLNVSSANAIIVVSYIGFATKEIPLNNESNITVALQESASELDEVVVVGYGTQRKVNLTGAVETVKVEGLSDRPITQASSALQGQVAGAFISQNGAQPGNDQATILIRGIGSLGNNNPLVIIDGMEGSLKDVNPKDMESVSVLKDAASAAIYGNRASNGVILITTKRGKKGKNKIEYTGYLGVQSVTDFPELLKGLDHYDLNALAVANANGGIFPSWYSEEVRQNFINKVDEQRWPTNYSWSDDIIVDAIINDHHINISGGQENFQYSASVGYLDQEGIVDGNATKRLTFRTNLSSYFLKDNRLRLDLNLSGYDQNTEDFVTGINEVMYHVFVQSPLTRRQLEGVGYTGAGYNWAVLDAGGGRNSNSSPLTVRLAGSLKVLDNLEVKSSINFYRTGDELEIWRPSVTTFGLQADGTIIESSPSNSSLDINTSKSLTKVFNSQVNYNTEFVEGFKLNVMAGLEAREYNFSSKFMSRSNFSANLPNLEIGDPSTQKNGGSDLEGKWLSYFGRFNLDISDKYLLEGTIRRDGSSRFLDKWGTFPSVSLGWKLSNEDFLKDNDFINSLKLRASWGQLGNENINSYYAASDELSLNLFANFNNSVTPAGAITILANQATSWETSEQINFGVDFGLLKNKITGSIDYFVKKNSDILMQLPLSSTLGLSTFPYQNVAAMENKGIELLLSYSGKIKEVEFNANLTASNTKTKITDLAGQDPIIFNDIIWQEGHPFNSFYGYQTEGIYQSQAEIDAHLTATGMGNTYAGLVAEPGDIRLKDRNNDGLINEDDKTILGQSFPDWIFSTNLDFKWKNWDLSLFFQGVTGLNTFNRQFAVFPFHGGGAGTGAWYKNGWTQENPSETIQRVITDNSRFDLISDYYLEDASYLRLKNITLGYSLPSSLVDGLGITSFRIHGNIQNALTWTKMRYGFDPEKPGSTTSSLQYPQSRIYSLGINVKF